MDIRPLIGALLELFLSFSSVEDILAVVLGHIYDYSI